MSFRIEVITNRTNHIANRLGFPFYVPSLIDGLSPWTTGIHRYETRIDAENAASRLVSSWMCVRQWRVKNESL